MAAFPSLHAAFPFLGFLAVRETFAPRAAWFALAWCLAVWFSVVYLGEHYVVDVMAGVGLAALTWWVMNRGVQMSPNDLIRCGLGDWSVNTFHRHMLEMTLSMVIPWSAFWMVVHFGLPSAGLTPAWFFLMPIGIAVMVVPMTALMLYRRHSGRDIVEMNASMFAGMLLVMPVVHMALPSIGVQVSLEVIFPIALVAMTAPMIGLMYIRREHYTHHAHAG